MTIDQHSVDRNGESPTDATSTEGEAFTRRRLVQGAVLGGSTAALLAACGGSGKSASSPSAGAAFDNSSGAGTPVQGGTARIGIVTGGTAETLNPGTAAIYQDILRTYQLFDRLFEVDVSGNLLDLVPGLALSAQSNGDASVWTVHLRPGVTWHDGKPFTADDVLWSIASWGTTLNYASAYAVGHIDFKGVRKIGPLTVQIPLVSPLGQFPAMLTGYNFAIIQHGATPATIQKHPIGTGPFKYVSFTPGAQSVFAANRSYWQHGKPYLDTLVVDTSYTDESTRENALLSGAIDAMIFAEPAFATSQKANNNLTVLVGGIRGRGGAAGASGAPGGFGFVFFTRVDKAPFSDVRVRQAFKLMIDRQQLIDVVFHGLGAIGNDTWGFGTSDFDASLVPAYDPEKAKSLLKAAGQEGLSTAVQTTQILYGFVESATLLAEQASRIGVKIAVQVVNPTTYFTSAGGFLTRSFGVDSGATYPSISTAYLSFIDKTAPYNDSHWTNMSLINPALAETDPTRSRELWYEVQRQQVTEGGTMLWTNAAYLDVVAKDLHGITASGAGPLNNYRLLDAWLAKG